MNCKRITNDKRIINLSKNIEKYHEFSCVELWLSVRSFSLRWEYAQVTRGDLYSASCSSRPTGKLRANVRGPRQSWNRESRSPGMSYSWALLPFKLYFFTQLPLNCHDLRKQEIRARNCHHQCRCRISVVMKKSLTPGCPSYSSGSLWVILEPSLQRSELVAVHGMILNRKRILR